VSSVQHHRRGQGGEKKRGRRTKGDPDRTQVVRWKHGHAKKTANVKDETQVFPGGGEGELGRDLFSSWACGEVGQGTKTKAKPGTNKREKTRPTSKEEQLGEIFF